MRNPWPLSDIFGVSPEPGRSSREGTIRWNGEKEGIHGTLEFIDLEMPALLPEGVRVLAEFEFKGQNTPVVFEVPFGKGRIIYTPALLGAATWEMQRRPGEKYLSTPGTVFRPFMDRLISVAVPSPSHLRKVESTSPVITNMHTLGGEKQRFVLHVLNAAGGRLAPGQTVSFTVNESVWNRDAAPVRAEIQLPADFTAYAVSPDFEGRKPIPLQALEDGWSAVTLPPELLNRYAMIFFEPPVLQETEEQQEPL